MIRYILLAALFGVTATAATAQDVFLDSNYGCGQFVQVYSCPPPVVYYHFPTIYYRSPITYVEPTVKHDIYNNDSISSKFYVKARFSDYNNYKCEIPVINGYLPIVQVTTDSYGRVSRLALDYRTKEFLYYHYSGKSEIVYRKNNIAASSSGATKRPAPKVTESVTDIDPAKKTMPKVEDRGSPWLFEKRPAPKLFDDKGTTPALPRPTPAKDAEIEKLLKELRGSGEFKSSGCSVPVAPKVEASKVEIIVPSTGIMRPSDVTQPESEKTKKFPRYNN